MGTARVDCHGNGVYLGRERGAARGRLLLSCWRVSGPALFLWLPPRDLQGPGLAPPATRRKGPRDRRDGVTTGGVNFDPVRWRRNGDYDLDGKSNLALYPSDTGDWLLRHADGTAPASPSLAGRDGAPPPTTSTATARLIPRSTMPPPAGGACAARIAGRVVLTHGGPGFTPLRGDLDGDGWADYLLYDGAVRWSLRVRGDRRSRGVRRQRALPVPADYDGDEKTTSRSTTRPPPVVMRWSRNLTVRRPRSAGPGRRP